MNKDIKDFLRVYFIIGKVLIMYLLLNQNWLGIKINSKTVNNFKIIASIIYYSMMEIVSKIKLFQKIHLNSREPIQSYVYSKYELRMLYEENKKFISNLNLLIFKWMSATNKLLIKFINK